MPSKRMDDEWHWQTLLRRPIRPPEGAVEVEGIAEPLTVEEKAMTVPPPRIVREQGMHLSRPRAHVLTFASDGLRAIIESSPLLSQRVDRLLEEVTFTVAPRTRSGRSLQEYRGRIAVLPEDEFEGLRPDDNAVANVRYMLEQLGFDVLRVGRFGISARGPAALVADVLGSELQVMALPHAPQTRAMATSLLGDAGQIPAPDQLFVMPAGSMSLRTRIGNHLDSFHFTPPPELFTPVSSQAPAVTWQAIGANELRQALRVPAGGPTGAEVRVGIVDTGFFAHPYYLPFNISRTRIVTSGDPQRDDVGHGTAILFNLVSIAPDAEITAFALSDPPQDSLESAFDEHQCRVISCSWGWDREAVSPVLEASVRDLAHHGAIILFAAGNGQYAWPGSMPDVLSVGGVYSNPSSGALEVSNFASGFLSTQYPGRVVPDICGLCGQVPKGIYILMPTRPGSQLDRDHGGTAYAPYGQGDDTTKTDGWVGASGTSSATPQVAGVVALMLEAASRAGKTLEAAQVRNLLAETCTPILHGRNALGISASPNVPNPATGYGLVNVDAVLTRMRALGLA